MEIHSNYPLAIDGKNFDALSLVFTDDVIANYSSPLGILTLLSTLKEILKKSLASVTTHNMLGTQVVEVLGDGEARSVTYYRAAHFGEEETYGEVCMDGYSHWMVLADFWYLGQDATTSGRTWSDELTWNVWLIVVVCGYRSFGRTAIIRIVGSGIRRRVSGGSIGEVCSIW